MLILAEGVARMVRAPCNVLVCRFAWALLFAHFRAKRHIVVARCIVVGCLQIRPPPPPVQRMPCPTFGTLLVGYWA